jgi:hypothetical protein
MSVVKYQYKLKARSCGSSFIRDPELVLKDMEKPRLKPALGSFLMD